MQMSQNLLLLLLVADSLLARDGMAISDARLIDCRPAPAGDRRMPTAQDLLDNLLRQK
jgi:hypothetical protein